MSESDSDGTWVDERDWELGDVPDDLAAELAGEFAPPPVVAVVGRPNVGKSTLVNRILGRREAVVQDIPGVTRDRVSYDANWLGRRFVVQDTGGWEPDAKGLQQLVAEQAAVAMRTAVTDSDRENLAGASHLLTLFDSSEFTEDDDADLVRL